MKAFITILLATAIGSLQAQNWLTTGNTVTGGEKLGSTNNKSLLLITNNQTRMKINNNGLVSIGTTTPASTDKFTVNTTAPAPTGVYSATKGIASVVTGNAGATYLSPAFAVYGVSETNNGWGTGGHFEGDLYGVYGSSWQYGVFGFGNGDGETFGVKGIADGLDICYGMYGISPSDATNYNYGVYGYAEGAWFSNVGVLGNVPVGADGAAGYFDGDVQYTGGIFDVSDAQFKTNVEDMTDALSKLMLLQPKTYAFNQDTYKGINFGKAETEIGFLAQDLEKVFPQLVQEFIAPVDPFTKNGSVDSKSDPFTYKAVNYVGLIPVLTAAIQEQQKEIEAGNSTIAQQQKQIDALSVSLQTLQQRLNWIEQSASKATDQPGNANSAASALGQNMPNPFSNGTTIPYTINGAFQSARIIISDVQGRVIYTVDITQCGSGAIEISRQQVPAGSYVYTLIVDDVITDSRSMQVMQ